MRRAEWRRRADDPKGLLGWWWRGMVKRRSLVFALWLLGFVLWLFGWSSVMVWIGGWVWLPLGLALFAVLGNPFRTRDALGELLLEPAPEGQFRAAVEYRRNGLVTGRDEMALTVVDGWLVGEGVRSEFALRSVDVEALRSQSEEGHLWLVDRSEIRLSGMSNLDRLVLERWREGAVAPVGEPTFPPARAHERETARWGGWIVGGMMVLAVALTLWTSGLVGHLGMTAVALVGGIALLIGVRFSSQLESISASTLSKRFDSPRPSRTTGSSLFDLSPRPSLQNELSGEGESVRVG